MADNPTVCAIATAPAPGGIGIMRVSGVHALAVALPLAPKVPFPPEPRRAYFTPLLDRKGAVIDEGLFLFFRGPRSFTGEDVVELHAHGGLELLSLLQRELLADGRVRPAGPGEFTRRAFMNGRLDLAKAEAVAALVTAESEAAVRVAANQLRGSFSDKVEAVRGPLLTLHADLEGVLNFPDEAFGADDRVEERLRTLTERLAELLREVEQGELLRKIPRITLFGPANAGKSTLFNCLLKEDRALVDAEPGTTRDVLEARLSIGPWSATLVDTAGLRESPGRIEAMGMERSRRAASQSQLAILVLSPGATAGEIETWRAAAGEVPVLVVEGKADLRAEGSGCLRVSGKTGLGVDKLREEIASLLWRGRSPSALWMISSTQQARLSSAVRALGRALEACRHSTLDVVAGEVGAAMFSLGEMMGDGASEDLLDAIFQQFCIGK